MDTASRAGTGRMWTAGLRRLGVAAASGAFGGFVVGGIGGRLAMFLLRVTSDPGLRGLPTDDDFTIGVVSAETVFLLVATTVMGAAGGVSYLMLRIWVPRRWRILTATALGGTLGGAMIIRPNGIDFTLLDPRWLAVAMFVAIPAIGAAVIGIVAERLLAAGSSVPSHERWLLGLAPFVAVATLGPTALVIVLLALAIAIFGRLVPELSRAITARATAIAARVVLLVIGAGATVVLVRDITEIL